MFNKIMLRLAESLVGPFNRKEMSWKDYKWFRDRVADNLKRITIKFIILMMIIISIIALVYSIRHPQRHGHYEPEYVSKDGQLIDIDHDGDTYKWVWDND